MSLLQPFIGQAHAHNLQSTPSDLTPGVRLTGAGTAHAKGSWTSLIDPVPFDVHGLLLGVGNTRASATRTDTMLDLAIGPTGGGSEHVILPELLVGWRDGWLTSGTVYWLPLFVPRGRRLSGRIQALQTSKTCDTFVHLFGAADTPFPAVYRRADAYGTNASSTTGTSHTPGDSGSYSTAASIGSTLRRRYRAVQCVVHGALSDTNVVSRAYHWRLLYSGSSAVRALWWTAMEAAERVNGPYPLTPIAVRGLEAGVQLQVQATCSSTGAEAHDLAYYCYW